MLRGKILQPDHDNSSTHVKVPSDNQDSRNQGQDKGLKVDDDITERTTEQAKCTARHGKVALGS